MAKKPKKRGVKPGTKRGPYKKVAKKRDKPDVKFKISELLKDQLTINAERMAALPKYTPAPVLTLCGQLEDAILLLENRISNAIAKINSLM